MQRDNAYAVERCSRSSVLGPELRVAAVVQVHVGCRFLLQAAGSLLAYPLVAAGTVAAIAVVTATETVAAVVVEVIAIEIVVAATAVVIVVSEKRSNEFVAVVNGTAGPALVVIVRAGPLREVTDMPETEEKVFDIPVLAAWVIGIVALVSAVVIVNSG